MKFQYNESLFWSKVEKTDGCWYWTGNKYKNGPGRFFDYRTNMTTTAHRIAYMIANKEDCYGKRVEQTCGNKLCVNPAHLRLKEMKHDCCA